MAGQEKNIYYQERQELYGITEEMNSVILWKGSLEGNKQEKEKIFIPCDKGIDIYPFSLDRQRIKFAKEGNRWKNQDWHITRLAEPYFDKKGNSVKYIIPKGTGSYPFFPPQLMEKYESGKPYENLVLTEGYYKAFKGAMHGFDIIGLTSITHYKDRETSAMHEDVLKLIKKNPPKRIIWLVDGDCLNLSSKKIEDIKDLYTRPNQFFSSAATLKRLFDDYEGIEKVFAHIKSDALDSRPKGLDDLLIEMKGHEAEVLEDFNTWGKPGKYFHKIDMTYSMGRVRTYFNLGDVNVFISNHIEAGRKDLKTAEFVFNGTHYRWNDEKAKCDIVVPADAKNFFRVGDQYHEKLQIPNKYGQKESTFHKRMKTTIVDDHGKDFIRHVPKYKAFTVVPDHVNYQEIIHHCYNLYFPFEHEPEEGDCDATLKFLEHIFGSGTIKYKNKDTGETQEIKELDLGLDYMQLLYKHPTQVLPILCLVSRENKTGKTTFFKWQKILFGQNMAVVGNNEMASEFNAYWASKLIIACDETKIDKDIVIEKVKSLSTGDKIAVNSKGKDQFEVDFFGKFQFGSNNEDNFIYASEKDERWWVRKVPVIKDSNVNLLADLKDEIPAFLAFLDKRKMITENRDRAWFDFELIKTEALKKVIAFSQPTIEKEIRQHIRDMFFDFPNLREIYMSAENIKNEFFRHKNYERNYIHTVLQDRMKVHPKYVWIYKEAEYESWQKLLDTYPGLPELELIRDSKRMSKVMRYELHKWDTRNVEDGKQEKRHITLREVGRPYVFRVEDFLTTPEIESRMNDPELEMVFGPTNGHSAANVGREEDLPF